MCRRQAWRGHVVIVTLTVTVTVIVIVIEIVIVRVIIIIMIIIVVVVVVTVVMIIIIIVSLMEIVIVIIVIIVTIIIHAAAFTSPQSTTPVAPSSSERGSRLGRNHRILPVSVKKTLLRKTKDIVIPAFRAPNQGPGAESVTRLDCNVT